ncbi:2-deoxystreptamine glucosyltransferase [Microbacterium lemovicicum]|uniref:2-deoxystreptamine glucosyltransferase n=1 Tax=Microbacterium lemovicicum TaxID=1072463 RepID=A0A3Q9IWD2_9MICO|nr:glycosyltransferase [Microbacterium lemovicicum]AZS35598.1 2-deoxystreptamine glucosyltransferase [Microbacterium lemovicicum]
MWVVTRPRFRESIESALATDPKLASRLHPVYLDLSPRLVRLKKRSWDLYWYYLLWQRALGRTARRLHAEHHFNLAHHVTFANDWMPSGLTAVPDLPFIWGPVGGSSSVPVRRLAKWLGLRGIVTEVARKAITSAARSIGGDPVARRAALVVAQNPQVGDHFERRGSAVVIEPNASLDDLPARAKELSAKTAVFAGRLLAWKGAALAIDTIAHPRAVGWRLEIYGAGYDRTRLESRARDLGVSDRVVFLGQRPRAEVLQAIAQAQVFLFPSMHDQAGWVAAEANSIGCPTVCLPLGGPPLLASPNVFPASLSGDIVKNLAEQLLLAAAAGGTPTSRWSIDRLPGAVDGWYDQALTR